MKSELLNQGGGAAQCLSALRDGETTADLTKGLCATWASDESIAADWHAWSLIGDVMRSEELASAKQQDDAFLASLRLRLLQEPVVLAPVSAATPAFGASLAPLPEGLQLVAKPRTVTPRRVAGAAFAVGAMAVAGVLVLGRLQPAVQPDGPQVARVAPEWDNVQATPVAVVRSVELDRYLNAHRQFAQGPALAGPGGVRQVALTPDGR